MMIPHSTQTASVGRYTTYLFISFFHSIILVYLLISTTFIAFGLSINLFNQGSLVDLAIDGEEEYQDDITILDGQDLYYDDGKDEILYLYEQNKKTKKEEKKNTNLYYSGPGDTSLNMSNNSNDESWNKLHQHLSDKLVKDYFPIPQGTPLCPGLLLLSLLSLLIMFPLFSFYLSCFLSYH